MLECLLTQETSFFRYPAVFEALEKKILPEVQERKFWENPRTLRIWSAGCSTGEEPYSIAITLCEALKFAEAWEIEILATDISRRALRHAERGVYAKRSLQDVSLRQVETYFTPTKHGFQVKPRIRRMISFVQMNLVESVYVGKLDCIFCMNVLMYFSEERRLAILRRFYDALEPGGYFLLGHSETLSHVPVKFEPVVAGRLPDLSQAGGGGCAPHACAGGGKSVNGPNQESIELFLQEASENLQYLREYSGLVAGAADKARGSRKTLHRFAHARGNVRQLRLPAILRSGRERWRTSFITP